MKALAFIGMVMLLAGCRVNYSFTGGEVPVGAKTMSIALFEARAPLCNPQSAQLLTETVRDLLQAQTPLNLVQRDGDVLYEGAVTGYDVQPVAIQANETAAMNRLTITVSVRYVNTLDAKANSEFTATRFADYPSTQDLINVESALVEEISKQLAQDIFDRSLGNW